MEIIHEIPFYGGLILSVPDSILKKIKKRPKDEIPEQDCIPVEYESEKHIFSKREVEAFISFTRELEFRKEGFQHLLENQTKKRVKENEKES